MSAFLLFVVLAWVFRCGVRVGERELLHRQARQSPSTQPPHDQATFERALGV